MAIYDENNIFAKILRGELLCKKVLETKYALAFHDINPQAPVHVLVIPKGAYISLDDFVSKASNDQIVGFWRAVGEVAQVLNLTGSGFRVLSNHGAHAHQEVFHLHVHILGGRPLGPMLAGGDIPPDGTWKPSG